MKKTFLILALSIVANLALLAVYLARNPLPAATPTGKTAVALPSAVAGGAAATANRSAPQAGPAAATTGSASSVAGGSNNSLITQESRDLVARLRAGGFPEAMILAAAQARLLEQYTARYAAIYGLGDKVPPFWSSEASLSGIMSDPAKQAAARELSKEMTTAMKDLLGPDWMMAGMTDESRANYRRTYGDLPIEKIQEIQEVLSDFSQKQQEVRGSITGGYLITLPEDRDKLVQIEKDRRTALMNLMTPEQFDAYELRSSISASTVRSQLAVFNPTEEEFLAVYRLQKAFDDQYPTSSLAGATTEQMRERSTHQQELKDQILAALPPDRVEDYKLATESGSSTVSRIVARLELPQSTVRDVMAIQRDLQGQATALRNDRTLSTDVRNQALAALASQATDQITGKLGSNGFEAYRSSTGSWISSLVPVAPVARGGTTTATPVIIR